MRDSKEAERNYILAIENANNIQNDYITYGKSTLQYFQSLEEEFIDFTQNAMRKFFIFTNTGMKNILEENYTMQNTVEKISIENDINDYTIKNSTYLLPPEPVQYVPYKINLRSVPIEEIPLSSEAVLGIISTIYNTFEKIKGEPVY
jgi:hypothetical protein